MKIPLDSVKPRVTKVRILSDFYSSLPRGSIIAFEHVPDHYSKKYPDLPCFNAKGYGSNCDVKYEFLKKPTLIIEMEP